VGRRDVEAFGDAVLSFGGEPADGLLHLLEDGHEVAGDVLIFGDDGVDLL